jgi:hypothetical protein
MRKPRTQQKVYYVPSVQAAPVTQGTVSSTVDFDKMTPEQLTAFIAHKRDWLTAKMKREKSYVDRRAARGTHTPTDEAYINDQREEAELLRLFDYIDGKVDDELQP